MDRWIGSGFSFVGAELSFRWSGERPVANMDAAWPTKDLEFVCEGLFLRDAYPVRVGSVCSLER